jgi:hypothetical protein
MACRICALDDLREFGAEISIAFAEPQNLNKPPVLVFPRLVVCLHCGFTEFTIPGSELRLLSQSTPPPARG